MSEDKPIRVVDKLVERHITASNLFMVLIMALGSWWADEIRSEIKEGNDLQKETLQTMATHSTILEYHTKELNGYGKKIEFNTQKIDKVGNNMHEVRVDVDSLKKWRYESRRGVQ
jgi:hypothetical protein